MKTNSAHKSFLYDALCTLIRAISPKGWLIIAGLVLGVPTSYYGVLWIEYKMVKQDANCYSDLILGLPNAADPYQYADQIDAKFKDHISCVQDVDPKISSRKFIREEIKRL